MKKYLLFIPLAFGITFTPLCYAKDFSDRCGAYVKETYIDSNSDYRFKLVNKDGTPFDGSNSWSFTATNLMITEMLNMAHLSLSPICINYRTTSNYWNIYSVSMQ